MRGPREAAKGVRSSTGSLDARASGHSSREGGPLDKKMVPERIG